jgi:hypothetical protein
MIATLPEKRAVETLSGLSVAINCGKGDSLSS